MNSLNWCFGEYQRESGGGYSGGGRGWVPQMLCQKNIISQVGYGHGRAGHGSRGEPFPVEFVSSYARMSFGALSDCDKTRNSLRGILKHNYS
ncbi:hypothetical protein GOBAR_AA03306 [Gossypium barbadense]|uniref:Uncharacterized protein n=1 Tax=Gossypium barbadense TaxID=3634 RepID=A0A2P5YNW1_GOSBA|nr:hypothetical protein GOBAR_AA03306 [Gossypium barbadense]